jgi:hypothetical protein
MPPLAAPAAAAAGSSSSSSSRFVQPVKAIQDAEGLKKFLQGSSVKSFVAFILSLNQAAAGGHGCTAEHCYGNNAHYC